MERVNESSCIPKRYKVYYDRKEEVIMRKIMHSVIIVSVV